MPDLNSNSFNENSEMIISVPEVTEKVCDNSHIHNRRISGSHKQSREFVPLCNPRRKSYKCLALIFVIGVLFSVGMALIFHWIEQEKPPIDGICNPSLRGLEYYDGMGCGTRPSVSFDRERATGLISSVFGKIEGCSTLTELLHLKNTTCAGGDFVQLTFAQLASYFAEKLKSIPGNSTCDAENLHDLVKLLCSMYLNNNSGKQCSEGATNSTLSGVAAVSHDIFASVCK